MIPSFDKVQQAYKVYAGDYQIVNHPDTPFQSPFEAPNGLDDHGHRQYSATSIEGIDQKIFDGEVENAELLYIGCMDKDAALPGYEALLSENPGKKIMVLTMAGGIVQQEGKRTEALKTIVRYIAGKGKNLKIVLLSDHNDRCGYVAYVTGDGIQNKLHINYKTDEETIVMKKLILDGANKVKDYFRPDVSVKPALLHVQRQTETFSGGPASFDYDFENIEPRTLSQEFIQ